VEKKRILLIIVVGKSSFKLKRNISRGVDKMLGTIKMLCPLCSHEAYRSKLRRGVERISSLKYLYKVGNTRLYFCDSCKSFYKKRS